jgi:hypothetical protein
VHFGIDPVHFGIIMVVNLALGMITPPFGVNLFAACTVAQLISLDRIVTQLHLPFVLVVLPGCLMVITYVTGPANRTELDTEAVPAGQRLRALLFPGLLFSSSIRAPDRLSCVLTWGRRSQGS